MRFIVVVLFFSMACGCALMQKKPSRDLSDGLEGSTE